MNKFKVTMVLQLNENYHPQDFIPDAINEVLKSNEDVVSWTFERIEDETST